MEESQFQTLVLEQLRELKQEIRETRTELKSDIGRLDQKIDATRVELKGDIAELRTELKADISTVRSDMKDDRRKLEEVYQARNSVKINFGWQWSLVSFVIAIFAAGITQVFD